MEHYVTLFDSAFLPQGIALHLSLVRHGGAHVLWVLCMDRAALDALQRLKLPNVRPIPLETIETPELLAVKSGRSVGEYCWTMTPFVPEMVFRLDPTVERVTYVDADTWFLRRPQPIFSEFEASDKSVLITEHAYTPEFEQSHKSGKYCVQFVTFTRDKGERVRRWWAERCVEWCFARAEDGKCGDQMYLSDWPERFADDVHVLERKEFVQGPWNFDRFPPSDAIVYHFHGLRLLRNGAVQLSFLYPVYPGARAILYEPYLSDLSTAVRMLRDVGLTVRPQLDRTLLGQQFVLLRQSLGAALRKLRRRRTGRLRLP